MSYPTLEKRERLRAADVEQTNAELPPLINTGALARCSDARGAGSRFNGLLGLSVKPLKRFLSPGPLFHRAKAPVSMSNALAGMIGPILLLSAFAAVPTPAPAADAPSRPEYSSFRIITERNIFSPRRRARSTRPAQPTARVESFTLVGTMTYEKGPLAFFEGTSSSYRKVLKLEESIADYKVTNIQYSSVRLSNGTNEFQLPVGTQMRRAEGGSWELASSYETPRGNGRVEPATTVASKAPDSSAAATAEDEGDPPDTNAVADTVSASSGGDDPVLRRLMQRREQENNR